MSDENNNNNSAPVTPVSDTAPVEGQENQESQTPAEPVTPKMIKRLKLKVDNTEFDEDLPFEIDENNKPAVDYLKRQLQMSKAASKRMTEASISRKQAENFMQALQDDPERVLNDPRIMGEAKFVELAEKYLAKKLKEQMLSPEERKQIDNQERLRNYEETEKKQKDDAEATKMQQLEEHHAQNYQKIIISALETGNLPKNPFTVSRMANLMSKSLQHGLDLEPAHLAQLVKEDYQKELASLIGGSSADQILNMFGEDIANKIRKHDLAKFKSGQPSYTQQKQPVYQGTTQEPSRKMTPDQYDEYLKNKK